MEPDVFVTSPLHVFLVLPPEGTYCTSLAVKISTIKHYHFFVLHFVFWIRTYTDNIFSFTVVIRLSFVFKFCSLWYDHIWTGRPQIYFFCRNCFSKILLWIFLFWFRLFCNFDNICLLQFSMLKFTFTSSTGECSMLFGSNVYIWTSGFSNISTSWSYEISPYSDIG